jgi:uncharacterized membrane protein YgcG
MVVRAQQRSTWLVLASLGASAGYAGFAATRARPTQAKRLDVAHAVPPHVTPRESENPLQPKSVYSRPPRVPSEYDLNLGTAIDTLRRDYPKLFVEKPDLSIFTPTVELFDPSGKRLQVSPHWPGGGGGGGGGGGAGGGRGGGGRGGRGGGGGGGGGGG